MSWVISPAGGRLDGRILNFAISDDRIADKVWGLCRAVSRRLIGILCRIFLENNEDTLIINLIININVIITLLYVIIIILTSYVMMSLLHFSSSRNGRPRNGDRIKSKASWPTSAYQNSKQTDKCWKITNFAAFNCHNNHLGRYFLSPKRWSQGREFLDTANELVLSISVSLTLEISKARRDRCIGGRKWLSP